MAFQQMANTDRSEISSGDGGWSAVASLSQDQRRTLLFGAPPEPVRASQMQYGADEAFAVTNRTRSWTYVGQNEVINMNIIRTIRSKENFMLEVIFKLRALPAGNKVKVVELRYDDALLNPVPEQGTGRLTMQSMRSWVMGVPRRGLAFMMEDGLAMTDVGVEQYRNNIIQLANATIDSLTLDSYYRCLTAHNAGDYYKQFGMNKQRSSRNEITEHERRIWSILSKTKFGFFKLTAMARRVLAERRVDGDTLMLPCGTREYLRLNRPETKEYQSFGERGPRQFLQDTGNNYVFRMDGVDVFESSLYNVTETEEAQDPLCRTRTIGEFTDVLLEDNLPSDEKMHQYDSSLRTVVIHDNKSDTMTPISFKEMMVKSGLFERYGAGRVTDHMGRPYFDRHKTIRSWYRSVSHTETLIKALEGKKIAKDAFNDLSVLTTAAKAGRRGAAAGSGGANKTASGDRRSVGGASRTQIVIFRSKEGSQKDTEDLRDPAAKKVALDALSMEHGALGPRVGSNQEDLSPIFLSLSTSGSLSDTEVQTLANSLSQLLDKEDYSTVKTKGWVRYLRRFYMNESNQKDLYSTAEPASVREFLQLLYPTEVAYREERNTSSYEGTVSRMTGAKFGDAARGVSSPAAMTDDAVNGDMIARQDALREKLRALGPRYARAFPLVDSICPGILTAFFGFKAYSVTSGKNGDVPDADLQATKRVVDRIGGVLELMAIRQEKARKESSNPRSTGQGAADGSVVAQYDQIFDGVLTIQDAAGVDALYDIVTSNAFTAEFSKRQPLGDATVTQFATVGGSPNAPADDSEAAKWAFVLDLPICGAVFNRMYDKGLPIAIDFCLSRPHMTYEMGSAVFLKRGPETGATFLGAADFQIANETNRKVLMGFFTCETGCLIWRPDNLHVMHNIVCRRYMGGGGVGMWDNGNEVDRKNFMEGKNPTRNSIFVIPLVPGEKICNGEFDMTGEFAQDQSIPAEHGGGHMVTAPPHYAMSAPFMRHWGFVHREDPFDIGYFVDENRLNTICYRMTSFHARLTELGTIKKRGYYKSGCGHWGKFVYDGVREGRLGGGDDGYVITDTVAVFRNAEPIATN